MRYVAALALAASAAASAAQAMPATHLAFGSHGGQALTTVEYFCSPGFEPSYGGRCIATPARPEIELFLEEPVYTGEVTTERHYRRHKGLRERY